MPRIVPTTAAGADGANQVRLFGFSTRVASPAQPLGHDPVLATLPRDPEVFRTIREMPFLLLRSPLVVFDLGTKSFVNVEQSLVHLLFIRGKLAAVDPLAMYTLAMFHEHADSSLTKKPWLRGNSEISSVSRKLMISRVHAAFGPSIEFPKWRGPLSGVQGVLELEQFQTGQFKNASCCVKLCKNVPVEGVLCAEHMEWTLRAPIECGPVFKKYPAFKEENWLYALVGWPGVFFDKALSQIGAEQRGRILAGGGFFDEVFAVLAGFNRNYRNRCVGLAQAVCSGVYTRGILVRMCEVLSLYAVCRGYNGDARFRALITGISEWGYGSYVVKDRNIKSITFARYSATMDREHTAQLVHVEDGKNSYLVSAITIFCLNKLTRSRVFSYRVCASRVPSGPFTHEIDAACPVHDTLLCWTLPPTASLLVKNAEMLTWGLLYAIVQTKCGVTFAGSLTAACGRFIAAATNVRTGFVWHVVVQASRDSKAVNGIYDNSGPIDEGDTSLRRNIHPSSLAQVSDAVADPLDEVFTSIMSRVAADPKAERAIFGAPLKQALALSSRRFDLLQRLVNRLFE